jgi:hypothetical protein
MLTVVVLSFLFSCGTTHPHGMPPGQAKKVTGSKSAKPYAPGQQKKQR